MSLRPCRIASADFTALARGGGGVNAIRALVAARRSRTLIYVRHIANAESTAGRAFDRLGEIQRIAPDAVAAVLDHPVVGSWAARTASSLVHGRPARPHELIAVADAAGAHAGLSSAEVCTQAGIVRRVLHAARIVVGNGATFQLDSWPQDGLPADLRPDDAPDLGEWRDWIDQGWDLLTRWHPDVAVEFAGAISVLAPLRWSPSGSSSATLSDAFGCVFLSLSKDPEALALTFAHELQHTKLAALMDLFPLLKPGQRQTFYAPWRADPRPLAGLLHGTYAHVGVAGFWRRQRQRSVGEHAHIEFARWRMAALTGATTLIESKGLTTLGERFVSSMYGVLMEWADEPVPRAALKSARRLIEEHRNSWLALHAGSRAAPEPR